MGKSSVRYTRTLLPAISLGLLLSGCAGGTSQTSDSPANAAVDPATLLPAESSQAAEAPTPTDAAVQQHLARLEGDTPPVAWRDTPTTPQPASAPPIDPQLTDPAPQQAVTASATPPTPTPDSVKPEPGPTVDYRLPALTAEQVLADTTDQQLMTLLAERIADSPRDPLDKALALAVLRASDPQWPRTPGAEVELTPALRDQVALFGQIVQQTRTDLHDTQGELDPAAVTERLTQLFAERPTEVTRLELCRRVEGYGVYEPFTERRFVAGQAQRMIVYLELANFARKPVEGDQFEVHLSQEVTLYHAADGLAVWHQKPVVIKDRSRNLRRDFFVVQLITLPSNLGVGEYVLKVRGRDVHGGMVYARRIDLQVVSQ